MTRLLTGSQLSKLLSKSISADQRVQMAVAFWGAGAMNGLRLKGHPDTHLICNLTTGGTNPFEIRKLIKGGANVRMHNRLHAKIGIVGDSFSFVGSSNMSTNGLGFEGSEAAGWEEANTVFEGIETCVQARFDELWSQSVEISADDLKQAETNWRIRRVLATGQATTKSDPPQSLWDAIVSQSEDLQSLPCYVAYYYEMTDKQKATYNKAEGAIKIEFGKNRSAYQDWPELPEAYLIGACRSRKSENTIKDVDYSRRPPNSPVYEGHGSKFLVVEGLRSLPHFLRLSGSDLTQFKALVLRYVAAKKKPMKPRVISIQDLVSFHQGEPKP